MLDQQRTTITLNHPNGSMRLVLHYLNGMLHNLNNEAAYTEYDENEVCITREYYENNMLHNVDGPAVMKYKRCAVSDDDYVEYITTYEAHYVNNMLHNMNGPAVIQYYEDGISTISYEAHYVNNMLHNMNGPAVINNYENGSNSHVQYRINDELHNMNGPAVIQYNESGSIINSHNYNFGKYIS